jgi:voltage-gated potassium channel
MNWAKFKKKFEVYLYRFSRFEGWWLDRIIGRKRKEALRNTILFTESKAGRRFDKFIVALITVSVLIVIVETIPEVNSNFYWVLFFVEWLIAIIFTLEYLLRLYVERNPARYVFSFFGIVDLLSFLPTYLSFFFFGFQHLLIIRILRLLRIFRIFKLGHFVQEGGVVVDALRASKIKIYVFLSFVALMAILVGSLMYMVEHPYNDKLSNIPYGIYWAITTMTTVGYGDIIPITPIGRMLSTVVMILGYMILAVPTGIVTAEISNSVIRNKQFERTVCRNCGESHHVQGATYCHECGADMNYDTGYRT